ncbi:MAG: MFS transporter [Pseudomonadales bacterium]|jgi:Na+/melibiose symporter-like transporter
MSNNRKIGLTTKSAYGIGQFAEGLNNTSFGLFILFYYNQVLGVSGTLCGLALGIALVFDAITDPLAGSLSDNWQSRFGRRHPFMYASAIPLAFCFYALFSPPDLNEMAMFAWLVVFSILTRASMTLYHVPHIALGAELTSNFEERTVIVGVRQAFGTLGSLIAVILAFRIFFVESDEFLNGQLNPSAYPPFAAVLCIMMVVTIWLSAIGTHKEIPNLPPGPKNPLPFSFTRVFEETRLALENRSFRWLFLGVIIVFLMVGVDGALNLYMNTFFWELTAADMTYYQVATPIGVILGTFLTKHIHAIWDKKPGVVYGTAFWAICQIIPVVLRLLDWFPENGTSTLVWALVSIKFIQGVGVVQALVSFGSMVADITDEHELKTGKRQEGIFFGAVSFSNKSASGLGTLVAGIALDLIGWPTGEGVKTAADVPADALFNLGMLFGPIVAGFAVVSVWCYNHYDLTRESHQKILDQLVVKRAAAI